MVEIVSIGNGRYTLNLGGYNLEADYFKVEKLAEDSNYYLLWSDAQMDNFYLYNAKKQAYVFDAKLFKKIEYYSKDSLSFVAYRSDYNYAYMFYEDGYIDKDYVCKYIGEEYNGVRPIKTWGGKWLYYNVKTRKPVWKVKYGYTLKDGWSLGKKLDYNCFIVHRADDCLCISRYDEKEHKIESSYIEADIKSCMQEEDVGKSAFLKFYMDMLERDAAELFDELKKKHEMFYFQNLSLPALELPLKLIEEEFNAEY